MRTDPKILDAIRKWADDELRSTNSQIEFLLRKALADSGRLPRKLRPQGKRGRRNALPSEDSSVEDLEEDREV